MRTVLVIGGGPAGSLAATLLARGGCDVTLIEQHAPGRDKVCGECLSALGISVLHRADLLRPLHAAGALPLTCFAIHAPSGASVRLALPNPMLGLSRRALDPLLLSAAQAAGARLRHHVRAESIAALVTLRDLQTNRLDHARFDCILLADGRSSLLKPTPPATADFGLKTHFANVDAAPGAIHLYGLAGHYAGLAPVEGAAWNMAMSIPEARIRACPNLDTLFARTLEANPLFARHLARARRITPWRASPLPRFPVRPSWPSNLIPIGNAAAAIEPIGGEGMGLALRSAELAATALLHHFAGRCPWPADSLRRSYESLWRRRQWACRIAARWVSSPSFCDIAAEALAVLQPAAATALRWMGKTDPGDQDLITCSTSSSSSIVASPIAVSHAP